MALFTVVYPPTTTKAKIRSPTTDLEVRTCQIIREGATVPSALARAIAFKTPIIRASTNDRIKRIKAKVMKRKVFEESSSVPTSTAATSSTAALGGYVPSYTPWM